MRTRGKTASVNTVFNPSQPNLQVVVMQGGAMRGQAIAAGTEVQAGGTGRIVQEVGGMI